MKFLKGKTRRRTILLRAFVCFAVLLILAVGLVQAPFTKNWLSGYGSGVLTDLTPYEVRLEGLRGFLPFSIRLSGAALSDEEGVWLQASNASLHISPVALLTGTLRIEDLRLESLNVARVPVSADEEEPEPSAEPLTFPTIPEAPGWLRVDSIALERLRLGEPLLGETLEAELRGRYGPEGDGQSAALRLARTDGIAGVIDLKATQAQQNLDVSLEVEDARVLAGVTGVDGAFALSLKGSGPLSAWQGQLSAQQAGAELLSCNIALQYGNAVGVRLEGEANTAHALVPEQAGAYLGGDRLAFLIDTELAPDRLVTLKKLSLSEALLTLEAQGTVSLSDLTSDLSLTAAHRNTNVFLDRPVTTPALPASVNVTAKGPRDALSVNVRGSLADEPALLADWMVSLNAPIAFQGDVEVKAVEAIPEEFRVLLEEGLHGKADVAMTEDSAWRVNQFEMRVAAGTVQADGVFDPGAPRLQGNLRADLLDASKLEGLVPAPLAGVARVEANVEGNADGINAAVQISAEQVTVGETRLASSSLQFEVDSGWVDDPFAGLRVQGGGEVLALQPAGFEPQDVTLAVDVESGEGEELQIRQADVSSVWGTVNTRGAFSLDTRAGDFTSDLNVPDLAPILALGGVTGTGAVEGTLAVRSTAPWPDVVCEGDLQVRDLAGLPADAGEILAGNGSLTFTASLVGNNATVEDLELGSTNANLSGEGSYELETQQVTADVRGEIRDASALSSLAGQPLSGQLTWVASAEGATDSLAAEFALDARDPVFADVSLEALHLEGRASGLPKAPTGALTATGTRGGSDITLSTDIASEGDTIRLETFALESGANRVDGIGAYTLGSKTGSADLTVGLSDLAHIGGIIGIALDGQITGDTRLHLEDGQGTLVANLTGTGIDTPYGKVGNAAIRADVKGPDAITVRQLDASVEEAAFGDTQVSTLTARAQGTMAEGIAISGDFAGVLPGSIALQTAFAATASENASTLNLETLEGTLGTFPYAMSAPAQLSWRDGVGTVSHTELTLADGSISVEGRYEPEAIDLTARWESLPLALAEMFQDMPLAGLAEGEMTVGGSPASPTFRVASRVHELRSREMSQDTPGVETTVDATIENGQLRARVLASLPEALTFDASATAPLSVTLEPFVFDLPTDETISGAIALDSDLARTVKPFQLAGHQLSGQATARLDLGGTLSQPTLNGEAVVSDAAYTNTLTGTVLREMEMVAEATGRRAAITTLKARGPAEGSIEGTGEVLFPVEAPVSFGLDATLQEFRFADRDDITGILNGNMNVKGTPSDVQVTGDLVLGPATVRMPSQLPPAELTPVDYEMPGDAPPEEEITGDTAAAMIGLDVKVSSPGRVVITSPVMKTEWRGDLQVVGTAADPRIDGSLSVIRGNLDFLGRRFDLAESSITFDKSRPPDPFLDIRATSRTKDVTALLNLNGTMDNLEISLSSEPSLPEDEVLARVLFGKSLADVTPVEALQLVRMADMLRGGTSGRRLFAGDVRSPGVDFFDLKTGASGETSVVVGQYVTDKIYVQLEQGTGGDSSKAEVEAQISPQFSVRGTAEATGGNGLGFFWKRDY